MTLSDLARCDDVLAYSQSIHVFLWQACFPAILSVSGCRLVLKVFNIFTDY